MVQDRSTAPSSMKARGRQGLTLVVGLVLFVVAVIVVGRLTREHIRNRDRYAIVITDIDCAPPAGQERGEFLTEVQYLASLPDRLQVLDADLASRLADAFGRHPWVEKVERVAVLPPREIQVRMVYRTPVLAVRPAVPPAEGPQAAVEGSSPSCGLRDGSLHARAVDGYGILLPVTAKLDGLPVLVAKTNPIGGSGVPWGDPGVEAAARTAACLRPYQDRLHLEYFTFTDAGLELQTPSGSRVVWGQAPGNEGSGEAAAAMKVQRLLEFCKQKGSLGASGERYAHDVRPGKGAVHHPLYHRD